MNFRDAKLLEIKRVMHALAADKTNTSIEAHRLLHEYWIAVLCTKDGPVPAAPKESVRAPLAAKPDSSADQSDAAPEIAEPPSPPAFKAWLKDVIDGDGTGPGLEPA